MGAASSSSAAAATLAASKSKELGSGGKRESFNLQQRQHDNARPRQQRNLSTSSANIRRKIFTGGKSRAAGQERAAAPRPSSRLSRAGLLLQQDTGRSRDKKSKSSEQLAVTAANDHDDNSKTSLVPLSAHLKTNYSSNTLMSLSLSKPPVGDDESPGNLPVICMAQRPLSGLLTLDGQTMLDSSNNSSCEISAPEAEIGAEKSWSENVNERTSGKTGRDATGSQLAGKQLSSSSLSINTGRKGSGLGKVVASSFLFSKQPAGGAASGLVPPKRSKIQFLKANMIMMMLYHRHKKAKQDGHEESSTTGTNNASLLAAASSMTARHSSLLNLQQQQQQQSTVPMASQLANNSVAAAGLGLSAFQLAGDQRQRVSEWLASQPFLEAPRSASDDDGDTDASRPEEAERRKVNESDSRAADCSRASSEASSSAFEEASTRSISQLERAQVAISSGRAGNRGARRDRVSDEPRPASGSPIEPSTSAAQFVDSSGSRMDINGEGRKGGHKRRVREKAEVSGEPAIKPSTTANDFPASNEPAAIEGRIGSRAPECELEADFVQGATITSSMVVKDGSKDKGNNNGNGAGKSDGKDGAGPPSKCNDSGKIQGEACKNNAERRNETSSGAGSAGIMDFNDNCSLCHYLISIQELTKLNSCRLAPKKRIHLDEDKSFLAGDVAGPEPARRASGRRDDDDDDDGLADARAAADDSSGRHQEPCQACTGRRQTENLLDSAAVGRVMMINEQPPSRQHRRGATKLRDELLRRRYDSQLSHDDELNTENSSTSLWDDIEISPKLAENSDDQYSFKKDLLVRSSRVVASQETESSGGELQPASALDCGDDDDNNNRNHDRSHGSVSMASIETRPSSAHSRLCTSRASADFNLSSAIAEGGGADTNDDKFSGAAQPPNRMDNLVELKASSQVGKSPLTSKRRSLIKSLRGQQSLDGAKEGGGLNKNHSLVNTKPPMGAPLGQQHGKNNSLASRRCKSQSSKLIVINSNNASYTIQVTTQTKPSAATEHDSKQTSSSKKQVIDKALAKNNATAADRLNKNSSSSSVSGGSVKSSASSISLAKKRTPFSEQQARTASSSQSSSSNKKSPPPLARKTPAKVVGSAKATLVSKFQAKVPEVGQLSLDSRRKLTKQLSTSLADSTGSSSSERSLPAAKKPAKSRSIDCGSLVAPGNRLQTMMGQSKLVDKLEEATEDEQQEAKQQVHMALMPASSSEEDEKEERASRRSNNSSANREGLDHRSLMDTVRLNWQAGLLTANSPTSPAATDPSSEPQDETARSCSRAAKRLRELAAHLEHGSVPQTVLYQTLEYAASVLDSVTMEQISRLSDEEDGELSEVQSDAVPNEVRKWLETTFTRNSISQKRKSDDKLKFRSVANAIRAGIVVDRIYRRMSATTPFVSQEVSNLLKCIDQWSFDCFTVNQISNNQVLKSVGYELFNRYGLMYKFKIPNTVLKNFLTQIELGYIKHKNPYHNNLHAADVTQTVHYILWQAGLTNWLTDLEIFAILLAAIIHDYLHTGTTNNFHVMSQSETALIYNDRAVLENFHICQAFTLMKNDDCNILAGLSKDEYREFRLLVIDMVLATDMSSHFQQIKAMKNILLHSDNFNSDKSKILSLVIHISDISHPAKEWELHSQWTQLLMEEFFRQGDREKELGLECSPLCDRETTLVADSQLGFIEFIVSPSLEVCGDVLDRVHYQMAEANARPVLPASAKAASIVASASAKQAAIEPARGDQQESEAIEQSSVSAENRPSVVVTQTGSGGSSDAQQQPPPPTPTSSSSSSSSLTSSFVSSETLTSNLKKMIVSSSATISRKLNINTSSAATSTSSAPSQKPPLAAKPSPEVISDFESRQASYKHPVIQSSGSLSQTDPASGQQRPKSCSSRVRVESVSSGDIASVADSRSLDTVAHVEGSSLAKQDTISAGGTTKRATSSALATCGQSSRSIQQLQPFKIQRPWIACLERNKKMWSERSIKDARARELKERLNNSLKQEQIGCGDESLSEIRQKE